MTRLAGDARPLSCRGFSGDEGGRTVFETLLALCLVAIFLIVGIHRYITSVKTVRETALIIELSNIRRSVGYFTLANKRLPNSLKELTSAKTLDPKTDIEGKVYNILVVGSFVESMTTDEQGAPLDPFGNSYAYELPAGRVHSTTEGYEKW